LKKGRRCCFDCICFETEKTCFPSLSRGAFRALNVLYSSTDAFVTLIQKPPLQNRVERSLAIYRTKRNRYNQLSFRRARGKGGALEEEKKKLDAQKPLQNSLSLLPSFHSLQPTTMASSRFFLSAIAIALMVAGAAAQGK
jgi:hypothetical protein